jgi:hypothetical protein
MNFLFFETMLLFTYTHIAGDVVTGDKINRRCHGIDENPEQSLSLVPTTLVIVYCR